MTKFIGNQVPGVRAAAAAFGMVTALALGACTPAESPRPTHEDINSEMRTDLIKLSSRVLDLASRGSFGCGGDNQAVSGRYDNLSHEMVFVVDRQIPKSDGSFDNYSAVVKADGTPPVSMRPQDIDQVLISHDGGGTEPQLRRQFIHLPDEYRVVESMQKGGTATYYGTHPQGIEQPLTHDELKANYDFAVGILDTMDSIPDCGGAIHQQV